MTGDIHRRGHNVYCRPSAQSGHADGADITSAACGGKLGHGDIQDVVTGQKVTLVVETPGRTTDTRRAHWLLTKAKGQQEASLCLADLLSKFGLRPIVQVSSVPIPPTLPEEPPESQYSLPSTEWMSQEDVPHKDTTTQTRQAFKRELPDGKAKKTVSVKLAQDVGHGIP